ncbi:uncharacterized protein LOC135472010 isoform X2 [Liolophura sinensis]|uniref:uncharacterized protein LOC135472010 isoform X2 n=1 Tax=Liolophura sinensis TaxID=3198878 RepID=UPI0031594EA3
MGKKAKAFAQWITGSTHETSTTPQTPQSKDDVKKESERLFTELDSLTREYKRLRQVVEQLGREYEESKDYDPVRRYEKLKGMVKRTIMHLRVTQEEQGTSPGGASGGTGLVQGCKEYAFQMESLKKREEHFSGMSKNDIITDNEKMAEQIQDMKRKCSIIRDLVVQMETQYEQSKRFVMMQRYRLLKSMVKTVIHDHLIT